jgi:drug/metabolite transporter (DMT)-like permease
MTSSRQALLLMIVVVAVWGSTFVLVKDALADVSPLLFNLLRMTLAFLFLAVVYRGQWKRLTRRAWIGGAVVGLFLAMGYQFQTAGLLRTTPSKSAFLTGLTVVLVPLLASIPALGSPGTEPPRWNVWLGAGLAFTGIFLVTVPAKQPAGPRFTHPGFTHHGLAQDYFGAINMGDILSLLCTLGFALQIIAQDRFSRKAPSEPREFVGNRPTGKEPVPFQQLALLQIGFAALFMAVTSPFLETPYFHLTARLIVTLLVAALLATAGAFSAMSWAQHRIAPSLLALVLAVEPVFAWLTSLIVLREGLSGLAAVGALLILAGMGVAEGVRPRV